MPDYRRYRIAGGYDFFTVNLLERRSNDRRVHSIEILRDVVRRTRPFDIDGWGGIAESHALHLDLATGR